MKIFMHRSYNPFVTKKDELSVVRDNDSRYLGNQMFWKYLDRIPSKHLYRPVTIEYRTMKVIFLETILVIFILVLFALYIPFTHPPPAQTASAHTNPYWLSEATPSAVANVYDWLGANLTCGVFSRSTEYADVSGYLSFPPDWLLMNRSSAVAFVEEEGLFDLSEVSTGWDRRVIGGEPSMNLLLLGPVRMREISVIASPSSSCGLNIETCFPVPVSESSILDESRPAPLVFLPSNITLETTLSVPPDTLLGDGYIYDMSLNKSDAVSDIQGLELSDWIVESTRAVVVEISFLNSRVKAIVTSIFVFVFDGSGIAIPEALGPVLQPSQPDNITAQVTIFILLFLAVFCFAVYLLFLFLKQGPVDYFSSWWNVFDLVLVTIFFITIGLVLDPVNSPPSQLAPVYTVVPTLFIPQIVLLGRLESLRTYFAVLSVMLAVRLVKCFTLISAFRKTVKVFEKTLYQLIILLPFIILGVTGIVLGSYIILSGTPPWRTTSSSFYAVIATAARSIPRDLFSVTLPVPTAVGAVFLLVSLIVVAWVIVPGILLGLITAVIRRYEGEMDEAQALISADKAALYPPGVSRDGFWHRDVVRVFLYTWFHRVRGYELVHETEEEVGTPEDQSIELELLPPFLCDKWVNMRSRLVDMVVNKGATVSKSLTKMGRRRSSIGMYMSAASSVFGALKSGTTSMSGFFTSNLSLAKDETKISRVQLQRLIDSDPSIIPTLLQQMPEVGTKTIRALDIIRKYKSREAVNRKMILDHLIGEDTVLTGSGTSGQTGLMRAINDIDTFYQGEVFSISEACTDLSKDLLELKSALDGFKFKRSVPGIRPINPPR